MELYKYVMNQYLGGSLNNFVCEELIWMIFICTSIPIKTENLFVKIQTSENDEPQSQLNQTNLLPWFIYIFANSNNKLPTNFYILFSI